MPDGLANGADGSASREVLEAYRLVAADAGWLKRVAEVIRGGLSAEAAVQRVAGELHDRMRRITDPYLRERLADLEDLAGRLLGALAGDQPRPTVPPGAILLARRLGPAELLDWHAAGIAGVAVEEASPAGHAAILARALGLPAVGGTRGMLDAAEPGDEAVVDADEGQLVLRPEVEVRATYLRALEARTALEAGWAPLRDRPGITADGVKVSLMLNVGLSMEVAQLDTTGAEGIGLYRTEIAMLARGAIADVAEQAASYARVLDAAGGPAGAVPHARSGRRQAAARRCAGGGEPGDGLALAAHRAGPAGPAAPAVARPAAGGRRAAAVGDVSHGRHGGGVPRRTRAAAGRGAAGAPGAGAARHRHHARSAGADVAAG